VIGAGFRLGSAIGGGSYKCSRHVTSFIRFPDKLVVKLSARYYVSRNQIEKRAPTPLLWGRDSAVLGAHHSPFRLADACYVLLLLRILLLRRSE
jgi:hypothetical protein